MNGVAIPAPEVTVVIPTRNRWALLERALRSALDQQSAGVEVVVVDDASDRVGALAALEDARVRLVRHDRRRGVAAARNTGISRARTAWVGFLDDDDVWAPDRVRRLLEATEAEPVAWVYSSAIVVDGNFRPLGVLPAPDPSSLRARLARYNAIPGGGSNVIARSTALERCGGFDESFSFAADWELWLRLSRTGPAASVQDPLLAYRHHAGTWALRSDPAVLRDIERLAAQPTRLADGRARRVVRADFDRYVAHSLWWSGSRAAAARRYLVAGVRNRDPRALVRAPGALLTLGMARRLRVVKPVPPMPAWLTRLSPATDNRVRQASAPDREPR